MKEGGDPGNYLSDLADPWAPPCLSKGEGVVLGLSTWQKSPGARSNQRRELRCTFGMLQVVAGSDGDRCCPPDPFGEDAAIGRGNQPISIAVHDQRRLCNRTEEGNARPAMRQRNLVRMEWFGWRT